MQKHLRAEGEFKYIQVGQGEPLLLLHGLFGALSNFEDLINHFKNSHEVVIPILPIYSMPLNKTSVSSLVQFVERFVDYKALDGLHLVGNSLGGHVALLYTLANKNKVASVTLTGSSGLFESAMGDTFPKRGDYQYIKTKTEETFYDPKTATKELVDEVFDIVNDNEKVLRVLAMARSALKQNLTDHLKDIEAPTLLIWGAQDKITPPFVGEEFHKLIKNSELYFIEETGHAPMMEKPEVFNEILEEFLQKVEYAR